MDMNDLLFEGIRNGTTFALDETTSEAIKSNPSQIKGKVVARTGSKTVGYGTAGADPMGFVESVEPFSGNNNALCVTVTWHKASGEFEPISYSGADNIGTKPFAACDGKGGLQEATGYSSAKLISVDATAKTCIVYIN